MVAEACDLLGVGDAVRDSVVDIVGVGDAVRVVDIVAGEIDVAGEYDLLAVGVDVVLEVVEGVLVCVWDFTLELAVTVVEDVAVVVVEVEGELVGEAVPVVVA
eukprot:g20571.t1